MRHVRRTIGLWLWVGLLGGNTLLYASTGISKTDTPDQETMKQQAWNTVQTINHLWAIMENMDSLSLYIHDDMVIFSPGGKERVAGKKQVIDAYRTYAQYAETISLKESEPLIHLYNQDKTAIVSYFSELTIKTPEGKTESFQCKDMYSLVFENGKWMAVAQHYSFYKE